MTGKNPNITDSNQSVKPENRKIRRDKRGRFVKGSKPIAGFDKHPENRGSGSWSGEYSLTHQYKKFLAMTPIEIKEWNVKWESSPKKATKIDYTAAAWIAARRVRQAMQPEGLADAKELADRTEGKVPTAIKAELENKTDDSKELLKILRQMAEKEMKKG